MAKPTIGEFAQKGSGTIQPIRNTIATPEIAQKGYQQQTAYQANFSQPAQQQKWYAGDKPTSRETLSLWYNSREANPAGAAQFLQNYRTQQATVGSDFYNPYTKATSPAVQQLANLGVDVTGIGDKDWFTKNAWMQGYFNYTDTTNSVKKPGKDSSTQEWIGYWYNQAYKDMEQTSKAKSEWNAVQDEIRWMVNDPSRNWTDDEIVDKIETEIANGKYSTLNKMNEGRLAGTPLELNDSVGYSRDALYGVTWAARNGQNPDGTYGTGNLELDTIFSLTGEGKQYHENPEIRAKLDPTSPAYNPYSLGSTAENLCKYFNVYELTPEWLQENQDILKSGDQTAIKMYNDAAEVVNYTQKLDDQLTAMNADIDKMIEKGYNYDKIINRIYDNSDYSDLFALDATMDPMGGKATELKPTGWAIDYKRSEYEKKIRDKYDEKHNISSSMIRGAYAGVLANLVPAIMEGKNANETNTTGAIDLETIEAQQKNREEVAPELDSFGNEAEKVASVSTIAGSMQITLMQNGIVMLRNGQGPLAYVERARNIANKASDGLVKDAYDLGMYGAGYYDQKRQLRDQLEGLGTEDELYDRFWSVNDSLVERVTPYGYGNIDEDEGLYEDVKNLINADTLSLAVNGFPESAKTGETQAEKDLMNQVQAAADDFQLGMDLIGRYGFDDEGYIGNESDFADLWDRYTRLNDAYSGNGYQTAGGFRDTKEARENGRKLYALLMAEKNPENPEEKGLLSQFIEADKNLYAVEETLPALQNELEERDAKEQDYARRYELSQRLYAATGEPFDAKKMGAAYTLSQFVHTKADKQKYSTSSYDYNAEKAKSSGESTSLVMEQAKSDTKSIPKNVLALQQAFDELEASGVKFTDTDRQNFQDHIDQMNLQARQAYYYSLADEKDFKQVGDQAKEKAANRGYNSLSYCLSQDWQTGTKEIIAKGLEGIIGQTTDNTYELLGDRIDSMILTLQNITEEEKDRYFYLLGKEGDVAAHDYFVDLMDMMKVRNSEEMKTRAESLASENIGGAVVGTLGSLAMNVVGGVDEFLYRADQTLNGKEYDPYASAHLMSDVKDALRSGSKEALYKVFGNGSKEIVDFLYDAIVSGAGDSLIMGAITGMGMEAISELAMASSKISSLVNFVQNWEGGASKVVKGALKITSDFAHAVPMGLNAANSAYRDAYIRTGDAEKAEQMATVTFFAETVSEAVTYTNMHDMFIAGGEKAAGVRSFVIDFMKDTAQEVLGESANELVESMADKWIMGADSNWQQNYNESYTAYKNAGFSDDVAAKLATEEADNTMWKDVVKAGLSAIVTAGVTESTSYVAGRAKTSNMGRKVSRNALMRNQLIALAEQTENGSEARADLEKINARSEKKGKAKNYDVGKLVIDLLNDTDESVRKQAQQILGLSDAEAAQTVQEAKQEEEQAAQQEVASEATAEGQESPVESQYRTEEGGWRNQKTDELALLLEAEGDTSNSGVGTNDIGIVLATGMDENAMDVSHAAMGAAQRLVNSSDLANGRLDVASKIVRQSIQADEANSQQTKNAIAWAAMTKGEANRQLKRLVHKIMSNTVITAKDTAALNKAVETDQVENERLGGRFTDQFAKAVASTREAIKVVDRINNGELKQAIKSEQKALDDAKTAAKNTKTELDRTNREAEAAANNLLAAQAEFEKNPADVSQTGTPLQNATEKTVAAINQQTQARVANENAEQKVQEKQKALDDRTQEEMNTYRTDAKTQMQQENAVANEQRQKDQEEEDYRKALVDNGIIMPPAVDTDGNDLFNVSDEEFEARRRSHFGYDNGTLFYFGPKNEDMVRALTEAGFHEEEAPDMETGETGYIYTANRNEVSFDDVKKLNDMVNNQMDERSGKTWEQNRDAVIEQILDNEYLEEGERREQRRAELTERADMIHQGKINMAGMMNNAEGFLVTGMLARKLGVELVYTNDTSILPKGAAGKYENGVVYLNSDMIQEGKMTIGQAIMEIALHEFDHFMENTRHYAKYQQTVLDFLFQGNQARMKAAIDSKIADYKEKFGQDLTPEKARAEIVADFAKNRLNDRDVVNRFIANGLAGKVRNALHNINQAIKNFRLTGVERETAEYLRKTERLYQKMIEEAARSTVHPDGNQFSLAQLADATGLALDQNTLELRTPDGQLVDGVKVKITPEMLVNTPVGMMIGLAENGIANKKGKSILSPTITKEIAAAQRQMFADLANMGAQYKDSDLVWEIASSTLFSAMKSNSDPQYSTTVDFGTICAKTQEIINVMSQVMLEKGRGLTRDEVLKVYNETAKANLTVPCPVCYVFSRWMGVPSLLGQMSDYQKRFVKTNADGSIDVSATQKVANDYIKSALEKYGDKEGIDKAKTSIMNRLKTQEKNRTDALKVLTSETATEAEKAAAQIKHDKAIETQDALTKDLGEVEAFNWVTQALCKQQRKGKKVSNVLDADGNYVIDSDFELTPDDVLFDLRRTGDFAKYTKNWSYRNTRGAGMGKAIMPYSGESIGDIIYGTNRKMASANPFLTMDPQTAAKGMNDAIARAVKQNLIGGQRLQSTSDFRPEWGLDYLMSFLELQAIGSKVQMYTKVAEAVPLLASMGADINLSIMGKGKGWHVDKNGNYVLDFSDVTGMKYETARGLKDNYDNVQMILVGMNDTHIRLALADSDIDFVIPWHASGNSKDTLSSLVSSASIGAEQLETSSDYTDTQSDKASDNQTDEQKQLWKLRMKILQGKKITAEERAIIYEDEYLAPLYQRFNEQGIDPDCYHVKLGQDQAKQIFPYEYWDKSLTKDQADENGRRFVDYCLHFGMTPRFSGTVKHNEDGSFEVTGNFAGAEYDENGNITGYNPKLMDKGYWKTLIDRPMYTNDGAYRDQQVVDVTKANIGTLENGKLTGSDMPLTTSAMYGPGYSEQEKNAVDNSLAAINDQSDLRASGQFSDGGPSLTDLDTSGEEGNTSEAQFSDGSASITELDQSLVDAGVITQKDLDDYRNKYTQLPLEGANPLATSAAPGPQRQFGQGMLQESDEIDRRAKAYVMSQDSYVADSNPEQIDRAIKWIRSNKSNQYSDGLYESLMKVSDKSFDYRSADGQARMVALMGMAVAKNDVMAQVQLAEAFNRQGTDLGRALQARKLFRLMTPEGRINTLQKLLHNTSEEVNKDLTFPEWIYMAAAAATEEGDFQKVYEAAAQELADQIPANWKDKLRGWRMLSMLGNPRTHIRNILGNAMFIPMVIMKNKIGAIGEIVGRVKRGQRTKTLGLASKEARAFASQYVDKVEADLRGDAKYNDQNAVKRAQKTWGTGKSLMSRTLGRMLQAVSDFNSNALEWEDWLFLKGHFKRALSGYMTANHLTEADMKGKTLENATQYAILEAHKATYRDANSVASALSNFAQRAKGTKLEKGAAALQFAADAILPFKKTPANILRRGIEYSPLGLISAATDIKAMVQTSRYMKDPKNNPAPSRTVTPAQFIDKIASSLTGTGVMLLGAICGAMGAANVGFDDDDPEDKLKRLKGEQEYGVNFGKIANSLIGAELFGEDVTRTMDWAAPFSMPFFTGVAIEKQLMKENGDDASMLTAVLDSITGITEPVFNLSMLDGVNSLFNVSQNDPMKPAAQIALKVALNYGSSYVPTLLGQAARIADDTRRANYVKSGSKPYQVYSTIEQVQNKIPGASKLNIPYRNAFGEAEKNSGALETLFAPWYSKEIRGDEITKEIEDVFYASNGDHPGIIPEVPDRYFKIGGETRRLEDYEYDQLETVTGETGVQLLNDLIQTDEYKMASPDTKAAMMEDVWAYAKKKGQQSIEGDVKLESWMSMGEKRDDMISQIVDNAISRNEKEYVKTKGVELTDCFERGDMDMAEAIILDMKENANIDDKDIRDQVSEYFRPLYYEAYMQGDENMMDDIKDTLDELDIGYSKTTFSNWNTQAKKQMVSEEEDIEETEDEFDRNMWLNP